MKRYLPLDLLRGLSVFGMVFSAIVPPGVLPAWMYHIQNPPPSHIIDTGISGIGWVDLVFPVFIFCMGVAIPISGRRRAEEGARNFLLWTAGRFIMLWLFSYLYVLQNFSQVKDWNAQLATIAGFFSLFPLYLTVKKNMKGKTWIRLAGVIMAGFIIFAGHQLFGEELNLSRRGIIIFLLAFLYLFGAIIWFATRNSFRRRVFLFILIVSFYALTSHFHLQEKIYAISEIRWFLNLEYFYFLMILIPATWIGDIIQKRIKEQASYEPLKGVKHRGLLSVILIATVAWPLVAFYNGWILLNVAISALLLAMIWYIVKREAPVYKDLLLPATVLLFAGFAAFLTEGTITKVPCTASYCFITSAASIFLLMLSDNISLYTEKAVTGIFIRIFAGAGSNPLMSYVAFGNFLMPFFAITGLMAIYQAAYPAGYPWIGVLRAFMAALLTMSLVAFMSEKKIYWRA